MDDKHSEPTIPSNPFRWFQEFLNILRRRSRSQYSPERSLAKLDRPSALPSMSPRIAELAPSEANRAGMAVVAISWPASEHRLASPMPRTVEFSH